MLQLEQLSEELQSLGGGQAAVAKYRVVVYAGPPSASARPSIVHRDEGTESIVVHDPRAPADTPLAQAQKVFENLPLFVDATEDAYGHELTRVSCEVCVRG
jgi:hypothetical protein